MPGAIITYEESGTDTRRRHRHNGYWSGSRSDSRSGSGQARELWGDQGWQTRPIRATAVLAPSEATRT